ncbi:TIGR03083 family protein [Amycolatopsis marina]|uniref:TIGR03083 family protein n=1 Tax=Amycolatopsis marina TaxID=490629 RepID=A0A1I1BQ15_9PSEU|nr:maleylpyruvate isomerase family mycothiol-dependent enzyme [Amycolatopsis marina]SFB52465.1 TIGR03083 family protein [Amycolatopsis marina]
MHDETWLGPRIDVRPLLPEVHTALLALLRELTAGDWLRATVCPGWAVQDVAAHVLADHIGRLSIHRDDFQSLAPRVDEAFPAFIHRINDEWVTAARRISPPLLIDLLSVTGEQMIDHWNASDMSALAWPVSWAGPDPAPVWLDAARDFSEYWTHYQQISEAVHRQGLTQAKFLAPVLDTFLRALPHTLRDVEAAAGSAVEFTVTGRAGGTWTCTRTEHGWALRTRPQPQPTATVSLDADTTWRLCTRGVTPAQARAHAIVHGDERLADAALDIVSIIY